MSGVYTCRSDTCEQPLCCPWKLCFWGKLKVYEAGDAEAAACWWGWPATSVAEQYWCHSHSTVDAAQESDKWAKVLYLGEPYTTLGHLEVVVNFHAGAGPVWMGSSSCAAPLADSAGRTPCWWSLLCAPQHRQDMGPFCLYVTYWNLYSKGGSLLLLFFFFYFKGEIWGIGVRPLIL